MEDTSRYLQCMQEVRERLKLIELVTERKLTTGREFSDVEFVFLQLRKILELIAFASLTANKEKYSAVHAKFATHWKAKEYACSLGEDKSRLLSSPIITASVAAGCNERRACDSERFPNEG